MLRLATKLARPGLGLRFPAFRRPAWAGAVVARTLPAAAFLLILALWAGAHLTLGLHAIAEFDPPLGDGPYQLFNPLRRIDAGQRGGVDFQYFHGVAVPYVYYPAFAAWGKDIYASELARRLVTFALYVAGFLAVFGLATRRVVAALGLTAAAVVIGDQTGLADLMWPSNSIVGVRSFLPFLLVGVLLAGLRPGREAILCGAMAGAAVLLGTEHGVAAAVMLGLVWVGRRWAGLPGGTVRALLLGMLAFAAALAGLLLLIAGPDGAVPALRYAFRDLPADQFWYFGAPPNPFLNTPASLARQRTVWATAVGPAVVLAAVLVGWTLREPNTRPLGIVLLAAIAYGLLAGVGYLGYPGVHYFQPLTRVVITAGLLLAWHAGRWATTAVPFAGPAARGLRLGLATLTGVLIVSGPTWYAPSSVVDAGWLVAGVRDPAAAIAARRVGFGPNLAAHLTDTIGAIDTDRAARGVTRPPVIWSTYAGQVEAHYGVLHPHTDYIIHAIGPAGRDEYLAAFRRTGPDYVVTFRRDTFAYEEWLENATWAFFEEVLLNYEPLAAGSVAVVWRRTDHPWRIPTTEGRVSRDPEAPDRFTVPVPPGLPPDAALVVEVEYEVRNPLRPIPVVGGLPRYLLGPSGCLNETPVSLPPYRRSWTFPVFPVAGQTPTFFAGTFSLVGGRVTVTKVHVRPLRADGRERALLDPDSLGAR